MGSGITLKSVDPADIPTPTADKSTLFIDSTNSDEPSYKDDGGTVHTLVGATGPAGPAGPQGSQAIGFVLHEEIITEPMMIPGPAGAAGGGGGGGGTSSGPDASLPGSGDDGELYLPTDGVNIYRYDGAAWDSWGPIYPLVRPVDGDFAWINQETASVAATNGSILLSDVAGVVANDLRIRKKAAPATPYTITAAFIPNTWLEDFFSFGLLFRESGTGELHTFKLGPNISGGFAHTYMMWSTKYNSPTSFNSEYVTPHKWLFGTAPVFMRIADDGVNRICSYSFDGQNWIVFHTVGRTDFLTADEVGFFIDVANTTYGYQTRLISWAEG